MDVRLINPFIESTLNVLSMMAQTEAFNKDLGVKTDKNTWGDVTGFIGLVGEKINGNLMISFDAPSILAIVNRMLMVNTFTEINDEVVDAVGEITNMICGGAKAKLAEEGFVIEMATPAMIVGKDVRINQLTTTPIIRVPFETNEGKFVIEASLGKTS